VSGPDPIRMTTHRPRCLTQRRRTRRDNTERRRRRSTAAWRSPRCGRTSGALRTDRLRHLAGEVDQAHQRCPPILVGAGAVGCKELIRRLVRFSPLRGSDTLVHRPCRLAVGNVAVARWSALHSRSHRPELRDWLSNVDGLGWTLHPTYPTLTAVGSDTEPKTDIDVGPGVIRRGGNRTCPDRPLSVTVENCAVLPGWFPVNVATLTDRGRLVARRRVRPVSDRRARGGGGC